MSTARRAAAAAALLVLALATGGCGDDGEEATDDTTPVADDTPLDTGGATTDDAPSDTADGGSGNPCEVVTQEQWEVLFGAGVTKSDASGGPDNCNILTSGASPGHEVSLSNLSASFDTTFDEQVAANLGCGDSSVTVDGVGDQAVVDTSCLAISGRAWVLVDDGGDILLVSFNAAEPSDADPAAVEETLTTIAQDMLAAR